MTGALKPGVVRLSADFSALRRQAAELRSLCLEAGDIPESISNELQALLDGVGDEFAFSGPVPAGVAGEAVIQVRFREGGKFDRCYAALRALRDERAA